MDTQKIIALAKKIEQNLNKIEQIRNVEEEENLKKQKLPKKSK